MIVRQFIIIFLLVLSAKLLNGQNDYKISRLKFNTRSKELAPAFFKNGLVFCSDRRIEFLMRYIDYNDNPLTNLYFTEKKWNGNFEVPGLFAKELTTFMFEGPSCFSRDGSKIYFTRSIDVSGVNRYRNSVDTTFGIFISELNTGQWSAH
jgi:hypothetical protein